MNTRSHTNISFNFKFARDNLARFACATTKCDVMTLDNGNTMRKVVNGVCFITPG